MLSAKTIRAWYQVHKWSSLVCTLFLLMLCLTGLPLVFGEEIEQLTSDSEPPAMPADTPHVSLDRIVEDAQRRRPGEYLLFLSPDDDAPALFLSMGKTPDAQEPSAVLKYDARSGALLKDTKLRTGFMFVMQELHITLFAGLPGTLFLGVMGLLFVAAIVSGVVVYGPLMRKLEFGTVRKHKSRRLRWLDLHNLLGVVTVAWAGVVGLTGIVNTLARPLEGYWQMTELAQMIAPWKGQPTASGSLQAAFDTAQAHAPGMALRFVAFPGNPFASPRHYLFAMHGNTPLTEKLIKPELVEADTGKFTASVKMPWYLTALLLSQPLHFGDYGGLPLKIVWAVLDLITIVVLCSGLYLWWVRRRSPVEARVAEIERGGYEAGAAPGASP
ncbi:MAG: Peptidase [Nevskia sp.]|nr:Peptidase [Nevskia sp.]